MKPIISILRILLLVLMTSVLAWHFAAPDERAYYFPWVYEIVKAFSGDRVSEYSLLPTKFVQPSVNASPVDREMFNGGNDRSVSSPETFSGGHGFVRYHCLRPETSQISIREQLIYRWDDALGNSHIGDQPPAGEDVRNVRRISLTSRNTFDLSLNEEKANLPAFAKDRFTAEIRQIYDILRKDWKLTSLRKTHINLRLIDDLEQYTAYQQKLAPTLGATSGFYSPRHNEAVIHTAGYARRTYRITRHEVTHAILAGLFGQMPTWFNEGVAEYFTGLDLMGQSKVVKVAEHHLKTLSMASKAQRLPDLRMFFDVPSNSWYSDINKADRYAMSWALVFFLRSHEDGRQVVQQFMNKLGDDFCQPVGSAAFFDVHYPGRLENLQKRWIKWLFSERKYDQRY